MAAQRRGPGDMNATGPLARHEPNRLTPIEIANNIVIDHVVGYPTMTPSREVLDLRDAIARAIQRERA